jgi:hypothetical protein
MDGTLAAPPMRRGSGIPDKKASSEEMASILRSESKVCNFMSNGREASDGRRWSLRGRSGKDHY